jgi:hypothetical protein
MSHPFSDTSRFWVIFDTCTLQDYYLDVHKLLAIPRSATLRYNYKEKYLSSSAITASLSTGTAPKFGVLFYAQRTGFSKGDATPKTGTIYSEMLWIPTRLIEMLCIPIRDGETFNYDFKVLSYPCIDRPAMTRILSPLMQCKEIPFNKWVAISSDLKSLEDLRKGDERTNWGAIVSEFHKPEFQFSSDVFWRIIGPTKSRTSKLVNPRYERTLDSGMLRMVKAVYHVDEGRNHSFEIVSAGPRRPKDKPPTQYSVRCTSTNDKNLEVIGSGVLNLRQEAADSLQFVGKINEEIADHSAALHFETLPNTGAWPSGPELEMLFAVVKSKARMIFGVLFGVIGLFLLALGGEALKSTVLGGGVCLTLGVILVVISGILIFRKLSFKS